MVMSFVSIGFAIWSAATARVSSLLVGLVGFVVLLGLGLAAQLVAEVSGAVDRDRLREEELQHEVSAWPGWKRSAFLLVMLLIGVAVILLRIWSEGFRPE